MSGRCCCGSEPVKSERVVTAHLQMTWTDSEACDPCAERRSIESGVTAKSRGRRRLVGRGRRGTLRQESSAFEGEVDRKPANAEIAPLGQPSAR